MAKRGQAVSAAAGSADRLADRVRAAIPAQARSEQRMFGGIGFMLNGNMVAGTFKGALLVRVGKERNAEALKRPGARPMEMRGRPLAGYVMVDPASLGDGALKEWVRIALQYVRTLPPKAVIPRSERKKEGRKK